MSNDWTEKAPTLYGYPIKFVNKLDKSSSEVAYNFSLLSRITLAEALLDLAYTVKNPRDQLIIVNRNITEGTYARIKLALRFSDLGVKIHFPAIVENWDVQRIIRECY
jgi:hypothetical protein